MPSDPDLPYLSPEYVEALREQQERQDELERIHIEQNMDTQADIEGTSPKALKKLEEFFERREAMREELTPIQRGGGKPPSDEELRKLGYKAGGDVKGRRVKGPFGRDIDLDATTMDQVKDLLTFGSTRSAIKALTDKKPRKRGASRKRGGGMVKQGYKKGGSVKRSSKKSIDGIAQRGKTRGTMR